MENSINFFHNENKILSSNDNIFYVKGDENWEKVENKNVYKGTTVPLNTLGDDGDYYIKYDEIYNLLNSSEIFNKNGWVANNVSFMNVNKIFPYSECKKIIPSKNNTTHDISYKVLSNNTGKYWCFSLYISPQEYNYVRLEISNYSESFGIRTTFSRELINKRYVLNKELEIIGNRISGDFDNNDILYDIEDVGDNFYRIYVSCKFNITTDIQFKFSLLKNDNGVIKDKYANDSTTKGLFINAAQLTNTNTPTEYIVTSGYPFSYYKFNSIYLKDIDWNALLGNSVYYKDEDPEDSFGIPGDLYFHNPIIKLGEIVRFGENHSYYGWKKNDNIKYYTYNEYPAKNDSLYKFVDGKIIEVGKVTSITRGNPTIIVVNSEEYEKYDIYNDRLIKEPGVVFWNKNNETYGYINSEGKVCNLLYTNDSLYNFKLINDAITYSTNLFSETWDTHYTTQLKQFQFGFNSGGHGNFWDYNSLRKYY